MSGPVPVDPAHLFEFVGETGLATLLVSVHPVHRFNEALSRQLTSEHSEIALGTIDFLDLIVSGGPARRFLYEGLRGCGLPSYLGVLPGYCFFRGRQMVAWDAGLPTVADAAAIARSALLGLIWSSIAADPVFMAQALYWGAEAVAAQRVAAVFREAAARRTNPRSAPRPSAPPFDELRWAHAVLGVDPAATDREVHQAWRRRRMDAHPDFAMDDAAEFDRRSRLSTEINRARDIIVAHRSRATGGAGDAWAA